VFARKRGTGAAAMERQAQAGQFRRRLSFVRGKAVTTRMTSATVSFTRSFILAGFEHNQPAGDYVVDTEEELVDDLSFPVWRRVSTVMRVTRLGATEYVTIDPDALRDALLRDHNAS
jgi:hypothetical protein